MQAISAVYISPLEARDLLDAVDAMANSSRSRSSSSSSSAHSRGGGGGGGGDGAATTTAKDTKQDAAAARLARVLAGLRGRDIWSVRHPTSGLGLLHHAASIGCRRLVTELLALALATDTELQQGARVRVVLTDFATATATTNAGSLPPQGAAGTLNGKLKDGRYSFTADG